MAAGEGATGFGDLVGPAPENLVDGIERKKIGGHRDDIHRGDGLAAHGINVGERVGGRDLPEKVRVVHDGREEVEGLDKSEIR